MKKKSEKPIKKDTLEVKEKKPVLSLSEIRKRKIDKLNLEL